MNAEQTNIKLTINTPIEHVMDLLDVAFTARVVGMWATDWHFEDNDRLDFSKFNDSDYKVFIYDSEMNHFDQSEPHKLSDGSVQLANPYVLTTEKVIEGLQTMANKYPEYFACVMTGQYPIHNSMQVIENVADVLVQCAIFKTTIYD